MPTETPHRLPRRLRGFVMHFQNWDDASDDFDTLEDWRRWATRNPDWR